MPMIKVRHKGQVTLPAEIRDELDLEQGDLLEAEVHNGKVVLTPKTVIDRSKAVEAAIDEGLRDIEAGRVSPVFESVEEMKEYLRSKS